MTKFTEISSCAKFPNLEWSNVVQESFMLVKKKKLSDWNISVQIDFHLKTGIFNCRWHGIMTYYRLWYQNYLHLHFLLVLLKGEIKGIQLKKAHNNRLLKHPRN
jgi:hypothetical protein